MLANFCVFISNFSISGAHGQGGLTVKDTAEKREVIFEQ